jgi:phage shock protein PspC (stress-responsive transcriptional regulator)
MHDAPPVNYLIGRSRFQGSLVGLTFLGGVMAGIAWHFQANPDHWREWFFATALVAVCVVAWCAWRLTPSGELRWDGELWCWTSAGVSRFGVLAIHLDLQSLMVLSLRTDDGFRVWLWPERRNDPARWSDLRRAVFSRSGRPYSLKKGAAADMKRPG